jgi:hypothetical protein
MRHPIKCGLSRRRRGSQRGAAIVEFALVGSLYLLLVMAILEFAVLFSVNLTMQYAVREAARAAVVGQSQANVIGTIQRNSMGFWSQVSPVINVSTNGAAFRSYASPDGYTAGMFGNAGDLVALQVECRWPLFTPLLGAFFEGGVYRFTVGVTMRNEAFS